jgi:hypothetical protein
MQWTLNASTLGFGVLHPLFFSFRNLLLTGAWRRVRYRNSLFGAYAALRLLRSMLTKFRTARRCDSLSCSRFVDLELFSMKHYYLDGSAKAVRGLAA